MDWMAPLIAIIVSWPTDKTPPEPPKTTEVKQEVVVPTEKKEEKKDEVLGNLPR